MSQRRRSAGVAAGQQVGQRDRRTDDRPCGSLGGVIENGRCRRTATATARTPRAVEAQNADRRRLARAGRFSSRSCATRRATATRCSPSNPTRANSFSTTRTKTSWPGPRPDTARQATVAGRSECLGFAWRQPPGGRYCHRPRIPRTTRQRRHATRSHPPPSQIPDRIARGQLSPQFWPQLAPPLFWLGSPLSLC